MMKFNQISTALLSLFLVTISSAMAQPEDEYYFLRIKGESDYIERITINDLDILGGNVRAVRFPISINTYLVNGLNTLKLVTSNDLNKSLTLIVERRHLGPKIEKLAELSSINLRAVNNKFESSLQFNLSWGKNSESVSESKIDDSKEILKILENYFKALKDKDVGAINKAYTKSLKLESRLRPKVAKYFKKLLKQESRFLMDPDLQITCQPLNNIAIMVNGPIAIVTAKNNGNLIESSPCEVKRSPVILGIENKLGTSTKVSMKLQKSALKFVRTDGSWNLAIPIGVK